MSDGNQDGSVSTTLIIKRGNLTSLFLYEITDYELLILEQGSPSSLFLNFSIFSFSICAAFFITVATVTIDDLKIYLSFLIIAIVSFFAGLLLLALWYRNRQSVSTLCNKIRSRIVQEEATQNEDASTSS